MLYWTLGTPFSTERDDRGWIGLLKSVGKECRVIHLHCECERKQPEGSEAQWLDLRETITGHIWLSPWNSWKFQLQIFHSTSEQGDFPIRLWGTTQIWSGCRSPAWCTLWSIMFPHFQTPWISKSEVAMRILYFHNHPCILTIHRFLNVFFSF